MRPPGPLTSSFSYLHVICLNKRIVDLTNGDDIWQLVRQQESADHRIRQRYYEMGDTMIWKMPEFDMTEEEVDHMFSIARKHKSLVLDLRDNPGGAVTTLERMVSNTFEEEVKIADRKGRKELKPQVAKGRGKKAFTGKMIILIDSNSGSAAEIFARVMQLEKRGTAIGDRSSGNVMEAKHLSEKQGSDTKIFYGFSVTDADLTMRDGKTLEPSGVVPDEIVLPTASDLADGKDPALVRAAELAGLKLEPAQAGKMFPYEWLPL